MKAKSFFWVLAGSSALFYYAIFYHIERFESIHLVGTYMLLFACYLYFILSADRINLKVILGLSLAFRLIPFLAIPSLSDDFYRFIWDGLLWSNGLNPFAYRPSNIIATDLLPVTAFTEHLYAHLNANSTYTVYPAIPQLINLIAYKIGGDNLLVNVIIQRFFIITADLLAIHWLIKILRYLKIAENRVVLYALNPLVILELSGNLHHEALMIAFFLGFIYYDLKSRPISSGLLLAGAIAAKLLPLIFLPIILLRSNAKLKLVLTLGFGLLILFLPLFDQSFFHGMQASLTLYYQKFEFNAGLYFLVRELGFYYYGYNAISIIGKLFFVISVLLILFLTFIGYYRKLTTVSIFILTYLSYTLLSLILHPWYILLLVALAPMSKFRFSLTWSCLIFLTYMGYSSTGFSENYWVVTIEYLGLLLALYFDWRNQAFEKDTLKAAP